MFCAVPSWERAGLKHVRMAQREEQAVQIIMRRESSKDPPPLSLLASGCQGFLSDCERCFCKQEDTGIPRETMRC